MTKRCEFKEPGLLSNVGLEDLGAAPSWKLDRFTVAGVRDAGAAADFGGSASARASSAAIRGGRLYVAGSVDIEQAEDLWSGGSVTRFLAS